MKYSLEMFTQQNGATTAKKKKNEIDGCNKTFRPKKKNEPVESLI